MLEVGGNKGRKGKGKDEGRTEERGKKTKNSLISRKIIGINLKLKSTIIE